VAPPGGEQLGYDGLVIATGVTPGRLPFGHDLAGVHVLRTIDDALALRADLLRSSEWWRCSARTRCPGSS
jgi:NADPH-dependent 2,4-dienoyl-CoA reductase/sulfur reductase-like enzyme